MNTTDKGAARSISQLRRLVTQGAGQGAVNAATPIPRPGLIAHRHLTTEFAKAQSSLVSGGAFPLHAADVETWVQIVGPSSLPADGAWLLLSVNGHQARIALSWGAARRVAGVSLESASETDGALLLEEAMSDWLDAVEAQTGLALRFNGLQRGARDLPSLLPVSLRAEIRAEGHATPLRLNLPVDLSPAAAAALANALQKLRKPRSPDHLLLRVAVEVDSMRLTLAEMKSLRPGDALVLDDLPDTGRLLVESQFTALAQLNRAAGAHSWVLETGFTPRNPEASTSEAAASHFDRVSMTPSDTPPSTNDVRAESSQIDGFDAMELRLSFRLGETLMTLADLRRAGPGTIITLDRPDGALVDIVINGQIVGSGEIIAVAGQRAIEIRSLLGEE